MKLTIATFIVGLVGLVFCIVSTAIDYWYQLSNQQASFHWGLWRLCLKTQAEEKCSSWSSLESQLEAKFTVPSWLRACQAFMILADLFLGFGLIGFGLFILRFNSMLYLKRISMVLCVASGVCALIAVSIFGANYRSDSNQIFSDMGTLQAGFGLAVCGALLGLITGSLIGLHKMTYSSI